MPVSAFSVWDVMWVSGTFFRHADHAGQFGFQLRCGCGFAARFAGDNPSAHLSLSGNVFPVEITVPANPGLGWDVGASPRRPSW